MQNDVAQIKGNSKGLQLILNTEKNFEQILDDLQKKLQASKHFFTAGTFIRMEKNLLSGEQEERLKKLFSSYNVQLLVGDEQNNLKDDDIIFENTTGEEFSGLFFQKDDLPQKQPEKIIAPVEEKKVVPKIQLIDFSDIPMMSVRQIVRGGQKIRALGSVVIFGNVNPGAEVVAGGNVFIKGKCQGSIHAGVYGATHAVVVAKSFEPPVHVRIADKDLDENVFSETTPNTAKKVVAQKISVIENQVVVQDLEAFPKGIGEEQYE